MRHAGKPGGLCQMVEVLTVDENYGVHNQKTPARGNWRRPARAGGGQFMISLCRFRLAVKGATGKKIPRPGKLGQASSCGRGVDRN